MVLDDMQLRYFIAAAEREHLTKAAAFLSVTQPALSRAISRLEDELGSPLFDRRGRSIYLNRFGKQFFIRARRIVQELDTAKQEAEELQAPDMGRISVGFLHTLSTGLMPELLAVYKERYPNVSFALGQGPSHTLLSQLEEGIFDLCLTVQPENPSSVDWQPLWKEEFYITLPDGHPLASETHLRLSDIQEEAFIHLKEGYSLRRSVERLFREAGLPLTPAFEGDEADTAAGLVGAGLGVSILPKQPTARTLRIVQVPIQPSGSSRTIGLSRMRRSQLSPAAEAFADYAAKHLGRHVKDR